MRIYYVKLPAFVRQMLKKKPAASESAPL